MSTTGDGNFLFMRPGGIAIREVPGPPVIEGSIEEQQAELGITGTTINPKWYGEKLDLDHTVEVLCQRPRAKAS